jgi:hypothetical protein
MDQIRDTLGRLSELSDEELSSLKESIVSEFESVEAQELSTEQVESMTELASALDAVREESTRREENVKELSRLKDEAAARVRGAEDTEEVSEDNEPEAEPVTEASAATPAEEATDSKTELSTDEPVEASGHYIPDPLPEGGDPAPVQHDKILPKQHSSKDSEDVEGEDTAANEDAPVVTGESDHGQEVQADTDGANDEVASAHDEQDEETQGEDSAVTAAADKGPEVQAPADRRPKAETVKVQTAITAGADIPGVSMGSDLPNMGAIAEAMAKRMHGMRRSSGGDGEQHTVATIVTSFPEDRVLRTGESESNKIKIDKVASPEAIVAAGGFCAPLETNYDILGFGTTNRPVRDSLASFNADRGGIRWMNTPVLGDIPTYDYTGPESTSSMAGYVPGNYPNGAAISVWNIAADEDAVDGNPTKPCFRVQCIGESEAYLEAVPVCLTIGNLMARAFPELIEANNNLALVTHARFSEQRLLRKIGALSTQVSATRVLGAARDFFNQVDKAAVAYRHRHRLDEKESLRVIVPTWLKNLIRADLVMEMPGNGDEGNFALADSKINSWFGVRNINVTWHIDGEAGQYFAPQGNGALVDYPANVVWYMFAEGTFLFLDGGTLDLGLVRDSTLNATNDYKMFVETFEGVAKRGVESLRVTSALKATGAAAGLVNTSA